MVDVSLPENLESWTYDKILNFVDLVFEENERLEYLNKAWDLSKEEKLCVERKICSFANTEGGYIIFGIKEIKDNTKLQKLTGLEVKGVLAVPNYDIRLCSLVKDAVPNVGIKIKKINIPSNDNIILVVKVEKNQEKPVQSSEGIFYIRVQSESKRMNRDTIKNLFYDADQKIQKRNNLLFELEDIKRICEIIIDYEKESWDEFPILTTIDVHSLKNSLFLNYDILKSKEIKDFWEGLLLLCRDLNETIEELKTKMSGGVLQIHKKTLYKSFNKSTILRARQILKVLKMMDREIS